MTVRFPTYLLHPRGADLGALFDFDFTTLALGAHSAASFLTATAIDNPAGLVFARSTISTVQTSESTLDSSPVVDDACVGTRLTSVTRGLVVECRTVNVVGVAGDDSPRKITVAWSAGTYGVGGAITASFATGPDGVAPGVGCSRVNITNSPANTTFGPFGSTGGVGGVRTTFSSWQRSKDASSGVGNMQQIMNNGAIGATNSVTTRAASDTWARILTYKGAAANTVIDVCDGRNYTAAGGDVAMARDVLVDYINLISGEFPREAISQGFIGRAPDRLSYAVGSQLIAANGQIKQYAKFVPKFSSTHAIYFERQNLGDPSSLSLGWFLFSWDYSGGALKNYAYFKGADNKLYVKIANGAEFVSTNAIAFTQFDELEVYLAVGNSVASVAKYRINAGAWVDLVLGIVTNVPAPGANPIYILGNINPQAPWHVNDFGQPPCWLYHLTYFDTGAPSGV